MNSENLPAIKRARIERLNIYEISDSELASLEQGSPDSLFLNFAIFFVSSGLSLLVSLLTSAVSSLRAFVTLVALCIIGFVAGFVLLALWLWHRQSRSDVFAEIRRRMPPEGVPLIDQES